jgi:hypothetical protein
MDVTLVDLHCQQWPQTIRLLLLLNRGTARIALLILTDQECHAHDSLATETFQRSLVFLNICILATTPILAENKQVHLEMNSQLGLKQTAQALSESACTSTPAVWAAA